MNTEDIVCDFKYAEKLKEMGVKRKGIFAFNRDRILFDYKMLSYNNIYPTYTVAELGEMLPHIIDIGTDIQPWFGAELDVDIWRYGYSCDGDDFICVQEDLKEANARVKLLIWLIENDHVNVENLNNQ